MKCWKCGKDMPAGASVCTGCSASSTRALPVTTAGKAMRQAYDHFGCNKVFDKKTILPAALSDLLEDSKKLRTQIDMTISAGAGDLYIRQLRNTGKPDAAFYSNVRVLMIEEAGLSDKVASELIGYFDEMIGWVNASQTATPYTPLPAPKKEIPQPTPNKEIPRPTAGKEIPRPAPNKEIPRPTPNKDIPRPQPAKPPVSETRIPLPTEPVPQSPVGCGGLIAQIFWMGIAGGCISGGIGAISSGLWPLAILCFGLAIFAYNRRNTREQFPGERKINCVRAAGELSLTWEGALDKFAIAIGNKWVLTGSGTSVALSGNLFTQYKPGEKICVTLAEITDTGVKLRGQLHLQQQAKNKTN